MYGGREFSEAQRGAFHGTKRCVRLREAVVQ